MAFRISKYLCDEIEALRVGADRIAKGDFSKRIEMESKDEIGELARSFQQMADRRQQAESTLSERAKELDEANKKIIEHEKLQRDFFSNVSHELRTPLALILAPLESMIGGEYGTLTGEQRKMGETMHNNTIRLLQMVQGLLDFQKLEAEKVEVRREPTDVVALTRSLIDDFGQLMKQKGLECRFECALKKSWVQMDRYLYERILFNLLSNAAKFTLEGGIVTVSLEFQSGRMRLAVGDTGIGISERDIPHLFQKFKQIEGSSVRRFEGTGLGLALIKEFAELLGGTVTVESTPGSGSVFTVECQAPASGELEDKSTSVLKPKVRLVQQFGIPHPSKSETHKAAWPGSSQKGALKVLIAEDNAELADYISMLLRDLFETRIAVDGEEALRLVGEWSPDLVLSDVMMPKRDGLSLCKEIKSKRETSNIPVILLTALTYREALLKGWEAGADDYLYKPFHPKELTTRIQSMFKAVEVAKKANEELEEKIRERTASLLQSNLELEQFAYVASHDLQEPLKKIVFFSDALNETIAPKLSNLEQENFKKMEKAAKRMQRVIEDLLQFSRLTNKEVIFEDVDLNEVLNELQEDLDFRISESKAKLEVKVLPVVKANRSQVKHVFQNLILNSIKFSKKEESPCIVIDGTRSHDSVDIRVQDNGIGFKPEYAGKIFQLFQRLHGKDEYEGTGIGLTICGKIMHNHHGRISAQSELGKGATLTLSFPIGKRHV